MKKQRGFSIGEVLVALFLLLVGMVDAVVLTARSVKDVIDSREMIIATQLAQEGTELVRNVRDNTVTEVDGSGVHLTAFNTKYGFPSGNGTTACSIDHSSTKLECTANRKENLYLKNDYYGYAEDGVLTKYKRQVYVTYEYTVNQSDGDDSDKVAIVTSIVVYGKNASLPTASDVSDEDIASICRIGKKCVYAQTRLTSWINVEE